MDKIKGLIGISKKSGNIVLGQDLVIKALRLQKLHLIIMASDISKNTEKKIMDKSFTYDGKVIKLFSKRELGLILGKNEQGVIGIKNKGLAESISKLYSENI